MRALKAMCCAAALVALLAPGARADEWNKKTFLTFSGPVQIPGATLPAGTYTFELADPDNARHVVRVSSQDGGKVMGMFMTIPQDRLEPPDDNVIMFAERPAGTPQAIQTWFYPGDRIGEEFVYPKSQAVQIAKATHKSVLATEDESKDNANTSDSDRMNAMRGARIGRVDENGQMKDTDDHAKATTTAENHQQPATTAPSSADNRASTPSTPTTTGTTATGTSGTAGTTAGATAGTTGTTAAPANTVDGRSSRHADTTAKSTTARRNRVNANRDNASSNADQNADQNKTARRNGRLPRTASNLTLFELFAGLSFAAALGMRQIRRRLAEAR